MINILIYNCQKYGSERKIIFTITFTHKHYNFTSFAIKNKIHKRISMYYYLLYYYYFFYLYYILFLYYLSYYYIKKLKSVYFV